MVEDKYIVKIDGQVVAENMDIKIAMILVESLFEKYYNENNMEITVNKKSLEF